MLLPRASLLQAAQANQAPLEMAGLSSLLTVEGWFGPGSPSPGRALVAAALTVIALRVASNWLGRALVRGRVDVGTRILVQRFAAVTVLMIGGLTVLGLLGVTPAALVTIVGAVSLAFSLALQDILKNFFSGIYLLLERPFRVGDSIKLRDQLGTVEHIGVRTTALRTADNVEILVPNAVVFGEILTNHSRATPAPASAAVTDGSGGAADVPVSSPPARG